MVNRANLNFSFFDFLPQIGLFPALWPILWLHHLTGGGDPASARETGVNRTWQ